MKYHKLRVAWSVAWGLVAVLLCVLWVRNYSRTETVSKTNKNLISTTFGSGYGSIYFIRNDASGDGVPGDPFAAEESRWTYSNVPAAPGPPLKLEWKSLAKSLIVRIPYRYLVPMFAAIAAAPWLPVKRYSLRTLLIATTLVAVALGLIVWASG